MEHGTRISPASNHHTIGFWSKIATSTQYLHKLKYEGEDHEGIEASVNQGGLSGGGADARRRGLEPGRGQLAKECARMGFRREPSCQRGRQRTRHHRGFLEFAQSGGAQES